MNGGPDDILGINILTNDLFVVVSTYLPKTSRALLAVALTAPSSSWRKCQWKGEPTAASKAIILSVANQQLPTTKSMIDDLTSDFDGEVKVHTIPHGNMLPTEIISQNLGIRFRLDKS